MPRHGYAISPSVGLLFFWNFEFVSLSVTHVGLDGTRTPTRKLVVGVEEKEGRI